MGRLVGNVKRRLASQSGASFVIALLFALVIAFVAAVAISSASVNAERATAANRGDDQGYYAVVSALDAAGDLVKRDVCTDFAVTVGTDKNVTATSGADVLGLRAWARDQVKAIARGGKAQPKNMVVTASDMGRVDVPDVLVTFTMANNGIFARACLDVWGDREVPADEAVMKADLVKDAAYANILTKQVASGPSLSGSLPLTVTWTSTSPTDSDEEGGDD